ncbi:MAG: TolC family protein [Burkholderiaceae bacterium]|nr:TolC family protein [Burkholderiaceae bacterium]
MLPHPRVRRLVLTLCLTAFIGSPVAQPAPTAASAPGADVESLLAYARERNPEFASMRSEALAAQERIYPAGALDDPMFTTELRDITRGGESSASLLPGRVGSTRYIVSQALPWWGKRGLQRDVASAAALEAQGRSSLTWNEIAMRVKTAHASRYQLTETLRLTEEIDALLQRLEAVARARYSNGLAPQADVIRVLSERTLVQSELLLLRAEARTAQAQINALLARGPDAPLANPARLRPLPSDAALQFASLSERLRAANPDLAIEAARLQGAQHSRDLTYRNRYPDFNVSVAPIQMGNRIAEWEVMFEVNIPLQQTSRRHQERDAEAMVDAANARQSAVLQRAVGELGSRLAALQAARETDALVASGLLPQAQATLESALAAYETGRVDFATLLDAQRQLRQARVAGIKAQAEARMRLAEIERLIGEEL